MQHNTHINRRSKTLTGAVSALALCTAAAPAALAQDPARSAGDETREFDIAAQPLSRAIAEFSRQSNINVVAPTRTTHGLRSQAIKGKMSPEAALKAVLGDAGLQLRPQPNGSIVLAAADPREGFRERSLVRVAQVLDAPAQGHDDADEEERALRADTIVVTGTNIRGIAPESSPTITFDREDIDQSGFLTTDEFIRSIPQTFGGGANNITPGGVPSGSAGDLEADSNNVLGAGVNIRGLGAGSTLTLLNGRRLSPAGANGGFVDVSSIPLSAVDRVEILTDGASSIYGGDAVGGVVNFVLRDDFEGAETAFNYGRTTEGDRNEFRANQVLGASWGTGAGLISYEYVNQDILLAEDKDFSAAAPDPLTLLPGQERHSIIANLSQQITPALEFSISGYYTDRFSERVFNRNGISVDIFVEADTEQFLVAPMMSYDVGGDWRLVLAGDYSKTVGESFRQDIEKSTGIREPLEVSRNESSQGSVDVIADGPIFNAPGGSARLAVGGAFRDEAFQFTGINGVTRADIGREVWAGFGELFVPVFSSRNAAPFVQRLELSASVRYDDYSDFGGSANPKFGLLWSPIDGLSFRGSYSTSFNPPDLGVVGNPNTAVILVPTLNPETDLLDLQYLFIRGNDNDNLGPEESETFTVGFDFTRDVFDGELSISSTYYNITFEERIGQIPTPAGFDTVNVLPILDQLPTESVSFNPSRSQVDGFVKLGEENNGFTDFVPFFAGGPGDLDRVSLILDFRTRNLTSTKTDGIDFDVNYSRALGSGQLTLGVAGDYIIGYTNQASVSSPEIQAFNRIFNPVDFRARGSASWSSQSFTASAFINYTDSYVNDRVDPFASVASWTTVDVNLGYRFDEGNGPALLEGTRMALSVRNLLDQDPPSIESDNFYSVSFFDGTNANPLGRFVSVNLVKSW